MMVKNNCCQKCAEREENNKKFMKGMEYLGFLAFSLLEIVFVGVGVWFLTHKMYGNAWADIILVSIICGTIMAHNTLVWLKSKGEV